MVHVVNANGQGFPVVSQGEIPSCFQCGEPFEGTAEDDGFPPGSGQFKTSRCPRCGMRTWFDRKETTR